MLNRTVRSLGQVRHVPGINRNLISLSALDSKGYRYTDGGGVLKVSKGAWVVLRGRRKSQLYVFECLAITKEAVAAYSLVDGNSG